MKQDARAPAKPRRFPWGRTALGVALLGLVGIGAMIWPWLDAFFPFTTAQRSLQSARAQLAPYTSVTLPAGEGPFPVVILMHGCAGPRGGVAPYAERAAALGVAALAPDSNAARGWDVAQAVDKVCAGRELWGRERVGDLMAMLDWVGSDPRFDTERVVLAGWSHGGWTVMDALAMDFDRRRPSGLRDAMRAPLEKVDGAFLVYPYCGFLALSAQGEWVTRPAAVEMISVLGDAVVSTAECERVIAHQRDAGIAIDMDVWEGGLSHAFDEPASDAYNPDATARIYARFDAFLTRALGVTPAKTGPDAAAGAPAR